MQFSRSGTRPSGRPSAKHFTGVVRRDPLSEPPAPARAKANLITFEAGARTHWHSHPLGQTLIITAGSGQVQIWGGPIQAVNPGDVVYFEPGEKHWHGAGPTTAMSHIAMGESLDGQSVTWMEPVSDDQFEGRG